MIPLTKEEEENYNNQKVCYICNKEFNTSGTTESSSFECKKHYKVSILVNIGDRPIIFVI